MNKLVLILSFLVFPFFGFSQNSNQPVYSQIFENYYSVKFNDGATKQTGYYLIKKDKPVMHGKWVLRANGEKSLVGFYEEGQLQSLIVYENGKPTKYTKYQLDVAKLKARISRLENVLANNE